MRKFSSKEAADLLQKGHNDTLRKTVELEDALLNLRFEGKASRGKNLRMAREVFRFLETELLHHMRMEDEVVFPFLKTHVPRLEPVIRRLVAEHRDFEKNLGRFGQNLGTAAKGTSEGPGRSIEKVRENGTYLIYLLRNHIQTESQSVYSVIDRELRVDEKKDLAQKICCLKAASRCILKSSS